MEATGVVLFLVCLVLIFGPDDIGKNAAKVVKAYQLEMKKE